MNINSDWSKCVSMFVTAFSVIITFLLVLLGLYKKSSKGVTACLLFLLFLLFTFEHSNADYINYVQMYAEIGNGYGRALTYEILYVWLCKIGNFFGLTFDVFRGFIVVFELMLLYSTIKDCTKNTAMVLALFMVFSALSDAELFRWLLGMCFVIFGIKYLLIARSIRDYIIYILCVVAGALIHSACWVYLLFLLLLIKKRKTLVRIVVFCLIIGLVSIRSGFFFEILKLLPIRDYVVVKYQTGSYANVNGIIVYTFKLLLCLFMGGVANGNIRFNSRGGIQFTRYPIYPKIDTKSDTGREIQILLGKRVNDKILDINIISLLFFIPMYYTSSAHRILHTVIFINYIALANKCTHDRQSGSTTTLFALASAVVFLLILLFVDSSGAIYPFLSHFTEGYFINFITKIFG